MTKISNVTSYKEPLSDLLKSIQADPIPIAGFSTRLGLRQRGGGSGSLILDYVGLSEPLARFLCKEFNVSELMRSARTDCRRFIKGGADAEDSSWGDLQG